MSTRKNIFDLSRRQKLRRFKSEDLNLKKTSDSEEFETPLEIENSGKSSPETSACADSLDEVSSVELSDEDIYESSLPSEESIDSMTESLSETDNLVNDEETFMHFSNDTINSFELLDSLHNWSINEKKLSNACIDRLLQELRLKLPNLPKTAKCLKGHKKVLVEKMVGGDYAHFDWMDNILDYLLSQENLNKDEGVDLCLNCDGIPLFNNSRYYNAYPLLLKVLQYPSKIFVAGIFCTNKKCRTIPKPDIFLKRLIEDLINSNNEFTNDTIKIPFKLSVITADAVMRQYLKQIVSHAAQSSCERCIQVGTRHGGHPTLLNLNAPLRNQASFHDQLDKPHHKGVSPIDSILRFDMVQGFALDYMHLCTIGITKRYISRLIKSKPKQKKVHLSTRQREQFQDYLDIISNHLPSEFCRKFETGLHHCSRWKATEYRTMMLYVGYVVMKDERIIDRKFYKNFLLFAVSMRILLTDAMDFLMDDVKKMLKKFVSSCSKIFGPAFISYNVHTLIHIPDDYVKHGNLEKISCFQFESFLGNHIKGIAHSGFKPLNQIASHIRHQNKLQKDGTRLPEGPSGISKKVYSKQFYKRYSSNNFTIKCNTAINRDNGLKLNNGDICIVKEIYSRNGKIKFCVQPFERQDPLFLRPCNSTCVGITKIDNLGIQRIINVPDKILKVMILPHRGKYIAIELLQ